MKYYQFHALLLQQGWLSPAFAGINDAGIIQYLSGEKPDAENIEWVNGAALPGFRNAHSHAFQYGMAGMAELHSPGAQDDFWSWREAMYRCALSFNPPQVQEMAAKLYRQLLRNGYTAVAEFHYLHHDKNGRPYNNLADTGERLVAAAKEAGIKITLIPVYYNQGNFGQPPYPRQCRFISKTVDDYFHLLESSKKAISFYENATLGFGVHSLRAATAADINTIHQQGPKDLPFHIHAAEQLKEVEDCVHYYGERPVEWLLQQLPLDDRFHLVHCTHTTDKEIKMLAQCGANVVLCPGTEANLGDGIFRLTDFARQCGSWSIGTDSHISLNPLEDVRWMDYAQRLLTHRRNTFNDGGATLIRNTFMAGCKAMGYTPADYFAIGQPLDAAVYHISHPLLEQAGLQHLLPAIIYTAGSAAIYGTIVNGEWVYKIEH